MDEPRDPGQGHGHNTLNDITRAASEALARRGALKMALGSVGASIMALLGLAVPAFALNCDSCSFGCTWCRVCLNNCCAWGTCVSACCVCNPCCIFPFHIKIVVCQDGSYQIDCPWGCV